jgi:hypothetical protein
MPGVRQALLQDLDGLNKVELTSHDWWGGDLDDKSPEELTLEDVATLDRAPPSSRCMPTPTSMSCGSSTRNSHTDNWCWPGCAAMQSTTNVPRAAATRFASSSLSLQGGTWRTVKACGRCLESRNRLKSRASEVRRCEG